jgi:DNA polymerase III subunit delta'
MTEARSSTDLDSRLCPWLREPLDRLEAARAGGRLGHAWLLKGPAGIGKINLALVFANRLLRNTEPKDVPPPLDATAAGTAMRARHAPADRDPDLHWLFPEQDKRTISVDQIRDVTQALALKGFRGRAKAVIVEPAESMTPAAANALLKTLEEPAAQTYLLLISHQPDRLLPTIRSRCQTLIVAPPSEAVVADWLHLADDPRRDALLLLSGRAPLQAFELLSDSKYGVISELEDKLNLLYHGRLDARSLAEEWVRSDVELALRWLVRRLQHAIRRRARTASDSKAVTHRSTDPLHNAWRSLPAEGLFRRLQSAEKLLDQLGSGINVELALHVLLLSLQTANRGRT